MMPLIIAGLLIGLPFLLGLLLRVNAVFLFLSVAVGDILVRYLSDDAVLVVAGFNRGENMPMVVRLVLLLLPVLLTISLLRKSTPPSMLLLQIAPLFLVGLTIAYFAVPLLPGGVQGDIYNLPWGNALRQSQDIVVGVTAVTVMLLACQEFRHRGHKKGRKHN